MDTEQIVRLLAADLAPEDDDQLGNQVCALCDAYAQVGDELAWHKPDCPWRLAREWVAAHPA
jgi:hypothetical protein